MIPPSWAYGISTGSLLTMLLGVLLGATLGTIIGTEIAYRRTERWLRKLLTDEGFRGLVVGWLKKTSERYFDEYVKAKVESEEFRELVRKAKEQALQALLEPDEPANVPSLDDFIRGGE